MSDFHKHNSYDNTTHDHHNISNHEHINNNHNKSHSHSHESTTSSTKKLFIMFLLTLGFSIIELISSFATNSLALFADFAHMLTDSAAILFALLMAKLSGKPANKNFSYGHGRADTIGAFTNALFMIAIVIFISYEAISRIFKPQEVHGLGVIIVSSIGLVINLIGLKVLHGDHSLNTRAAFIHVLGDMFGSLSAIVAGVIIYYTGWMKIDPVLSLVVSIIILIPAFNIIKSSIKILMEGVPEHIDFNQVGEDIKSIEGIVSVHDLHIWTMSSNDASLSAHIVIQDTNQWHRILVDAQKLLHDKHNINHITVQPELAS